jgi:hypothetical protein
MNLPRHDLHSIPVQIDQVRRAFEVLLLFPIEYISRTMRADLVKRALSADILICSLAIYEKNHAYICRSLTIVRVLVKRIFVCLGLFDQPVSIPFFSQST